MRAVGDGEEAPRRALVTRDRSVVVCRGLLFIKELGVSMLANPSVRARHSSDLLLPFYVPARLRAGAPPEERLALEVARTLALAWRDGVLGAHTDATAVSAAVAAASPRGLRDLSQGLYALEALGLPAPGLHEALAQRCAGSSAVDVLLFDPATQRAPHLTVFEDCGCAAHTARGVARCAGCGRRLRARARFDVLLDALVYTYHFERLAIPTDGCFFDVLRHLCAEFAATTADASDGGGGDGGGACARPAQADEAWVAAARDAHYLFYAVTHIVYTLNGFDQTRLGPRLLPARMRRYLCAQLELAVSEQDPDRTGEALVALRALQPERPAAADAYSDHAAELAARARVAAAESFLLRAQSAADGGWSCPRELDRFSKFHASLVAVAALREPEYVHAARETAALAAATDQLHRHADDDDDNGDDEHARAARRASRSRADGAARRSLGLAAEPGPMRATATPARGVRSLSLPSLGAARPPAMQPPWEGAVWDGLRARGERGAAAVLHGWLRPSPHPTADASRRASQPSTGATAPAPALASDGRCEPLCDFVTEPCALCRVSHAVAFVAHKRADAAAALVALAPLLHAHDSRPPSLEPLSANERALIQKLHVHARLPLRARALAQRKAAQAEAHEAAERARAHAAELAADQWKRRAADLSQPLAIGMPPQQPQPQPQPPSAALGAPDDGAARRALPAHERAANAPRRQSRWRSGARARRPQQLAPSAAAARPGWRAADADADADAGTDDDDGSVAAGAHAFAMVTLRNSSAELLWPRLRSPSRSGAGAGGALRQLLWASSFADAARRGEAATAESERGASPAARSRAESAGGAHAMRASAQSARHKTPDASALPALPRAHLEHGGGERRRPRSPSPSLVQPQGRASPHALLPGLPTLPTVRRWS